MTLTFPDPKQGQSGEYTCVAYNSVGGVNYTGYLLITGRLSLLLLDCLPYSKKNYLSIVNKKLIVIFNYIRTIQLHF